MIHAAPLIDTCKRRPIARHLTPDARELACANAPSARFAEGAISGSTGDYLQFLLPGTEVMAVVLVTVYTGVTLNADISSGTRDRFRTLPIWRPAPIVGSLIGDVGRYLLASTLVIALGLAIDFRPGSFAGVLLAVALVVVFAISLSWIWTAAAMVLRTPNSVQTAGLLVLFRSPSPATSLSTGKRCRSRGHRQDGQSGKCSRG